MKKPSKKAPEKSKEVNPRRGRWVKQSISSSDGENEASKLNARKATKE